MFDVAITHITVKLEMPKTKDHRKIVLHFGSNEMVRDGPNRGYTIHTIHELMRKHQMSEHIFI